MSVVAGGAGNNVSVTGSAPTLGIGVITAPGTVTLQETGGALRSGAGMNVSGQTVILTGQAGIGSSGSPFTVTAANLSATAKVPGAGIFVNDIAGLSTVSVTTNAGDVAIAYAGGSVNFTASTGLLAASGGATVSFANMGGDVQLGAVHAANITASGSITAAPTVNLTGGTVVLSAGAGIGTVASPIQTNVTALNATTTAGDIIIVQAANPLTVNATSQGFTNPSTQTGSDIQVTATAGDLTVGKVSALGCGFAQRRRSNSGRDRQSIQRSRQNAGTRRGERDRRQRRRAPDRGQHFDRQRRCGRRSVPGQQQDPRA